MKFRHKIISLILLQIAIIVTSFFVTAYLEAEKTLAGHTINVAGKSRVLTSQVEVALYHLALNYNMQTSMPDPAALSSRSDPSTSTMLASDSVLDSLRALKTNIYILKQGGAVPDYELLPIPPRFNEDWQNVADVYDLYYDSVMSLVTEEDFTVQNIEERMQIGIELIALSDILADKLGGELESFSFQIVVLQVLLGVINVVTHIILIWVIMRIFRRHAKEKNEQEKFVVLGEFASMLAHDMRNPLGTIYNSVKLVSKNIKDGRDKNEIKRINRSIDRMSHQIDGVLNYLKTTKLNLGSHSLKGMLSACINDLKVTRNIKLNLPAEDTTIYCDAKKMEFVFSNLLLNAVQAIGSELGYITITIKEDEADHVTISFEDSGDDITEENMKKIFDPLYTTKMHGTGLGLTSCRNIVGIHGGTISARNNPATFIITLPKYGKT